MVSSENDNAVIAVLHDLRAPLANVEGFSGELGNAVSELSMLLEQFAKALPAEFHRQLAVILEQDLNPCLSSLQSSVVTLDKQIDRVAELLSVRQANKRQGEH